MDKTRKALLNMRGASMGFVTQALQPFKGVPAMLNRILPILRAIGSLMSAIFFVLPSFLVPTLCRADLG